MVVTTTTSVIKVTNRARNESEKNDTLGVCVRFKREGHEISVRGKILLVWTETAIQVTTFVHEVCPPFVQTVISRS